ncbi:hypothetical protein [Methanobrevibacter sp.]
MDIVCYVWGLAFGDYLYTGFYKTYAVGVFCDTFSGFENLTCSLHQIDSYKV